MTAQQMTRDPIYWLGRDEAETRRLIQQSRFLNPLTGFLLREAGVPDRNMQIAFPLGGGPDWAGYENIAATIRSMLPLVLASGVATAEAVGMVTFPDLVGAWARKTG